MTSQTRAQYSPSQCSSPCSSGSGPFVCYRLKLHLASLPYVANKVIYDGDFLTHFHFLNAYVISQPREANRMTEQYPDKTLTEIQSASDWLAKVQPEVQVAALEQLAEAILRHFDYSHDSIATSHLFSRELPREIQLFAAAWLLRTLTKSPIALQSGDTERLTASLFDRTFSNDIYASINIEPGTQTFEKLHALTYHGQTILSELDRLIGVPLDLNRLQVLQQELMRLFNQKGNRLFLSALLPGTLTGKARLSTLFQVVIEYAINTEADPIHKHELACEACDDFEREAHAFGTEDSKRILGRLALRLKTAVANHFDSLAASNRPSLLFAPIAKKYPLEQPDTNIAFKIKITNHGTGPARDLRLDAVASDDSLSVHTPPMELGTIQAGESFVLDIVATVVAPCTHAELLVQLSWAGYAGRSKEVPEFVVVAQRADVDWETVALTEPYSLEAVTSENDLIGRNRELTRLIRLTSSQTVGSGFIYGQKRVGKTSLANAVAESLESRQDADWVVINKGSGDYVGSDASSTLRTLGEVLVQAMKARIPALASVPAPEFTSGLAPLSSFVDLALTQENLRLLFILDEFDELPLDLVMRTDVSLSLFLPLRQISNKRGCGFLLVGGESMQQIMNLQGDRLNKFKPVELDYFDKSTHWSEFADLIRRPVRDWLTISDAALDELFTSSAGNPYFAKLLASQLFEDMIENHYSDASEVDMKAAISDALRFQVGANSFAHFWTDGLAATSDNAEEIRLTRRSVLIAAGRAFRSGSPATSESIWREFKNATGSLGEEQRFRSTLHDFVLRKVLVQNENQDYASKTPLFQSWLKDKGVRELLENSRELEYLQSRLRDEEEKRVTDGEISEVCERLEHFRYRGRAVEPMAVRRWLEQFDSPEDQRLMFQLLCHMRVYSDDAVRVKMREAFGIVTRNLRTIIGSRSRYRSDILVSSLDNSAAKAGLSYCRVFAGENGIIGDSVQPLEALGRRFQGAQDIQRLVLVDDFSGTGKTLVDGLERNLELLRNANSRGIHIVVIVVVGFAAARDYIQKFIDRRGLDADVWFCDELGPEDKAFSDTSTVFTDMAERNRGRQVAEAKGVILDRKQPLGYGDTQALIVFSEGCPNNTLPIFWSRNGGWSPLFARR